MSDKRDEFFYRRTKGTSSNKNLSDDETPNGKKSDGKKSDGKKPNGMAANNKKPNDKPFNNVKPNEKKLGDTAAYGKKSADEKIRFPEKVTEKKIVENKKIAVENTPEKKNTGRQFARKTSEDALSATSEKKTDADKTGVDKVSIDRKSEKTAPSERKITFAERVLNKENFAYRHRKVLVFLSCVVVFCTVYALILPAITLELGKTNGLKGDSFRIVCGFDEHEHTIDCYDENGNLKCSIPEHKHTRMCYEYIEEESSTDLDEQATMPRRTRPILRAPSSRAAVVLTDEMIDSILIQKRPAGSLYWSDLANGGDVYLDDALRFRIEYTLGGNTLSSTNNVVTYQLPANIQLTAGDSGYVHNSAGSDIGTYTISPNGLITINFYDSFVALNEAGNEVTGFVSFDCSVDEFSSDMSGNTSLQFGDVVVNLNIHDYNNDDGDLRVQKSYTVVDNVEGIADFTVTIKSDNGTSTPPVLHDSMTGGLKYLSGLTVRSKNGNDITSSCTISGAVPGADSFTVTLPSNLGKNDEITVTYRAKTDTLINGTLDTTNKAKTTATSHDGMPIERQPIVTVRFHNEMFGKTGSLSSDESEVNWTLSINGDHRDISGWVLDDDPALTHLSSSIVLTDSSGHSQTITVPYTFPQNSRDEYTVTFSTDYYADLGGKGMTNTAVLTPPDSPGSEFTATDSEGIIGDEKFIPLVKTGDSLSLDDSTAVITWSVNIKSDLSPIAGPWRYDDNLKDGQYFTETQKQNLRQAIVSALSGIYNASDYTIFIDSDGFTIEFDEDLERGKDISFTYTATALVDRSAPTTFKNEGIVSSDGKIFESTPDITYRPIVYKIDGKIQDGGETTEHEYNSDEGKLCWQVQLWLSDSLNGDLTVTDTLPDGLSFDRMELLIDELSVKEPFEFTGSNGVCSVDEGENAFTLNAAVNGQNVVVTVPGGIAEDYANKVLKFNIWANVDNVPADGTVDTYTNTVNVTNHNETIGSDTQTQTVSFDKYKKALTKTSSLEHTTEYDERDNNGKVVKYVTEIPYTIEVNPGGDDLVAGSDTIKLIDELKYYSKSDNHPVQLFLKESTVHVYHRNADGTKGTELEKVNLTIVPSSGSTGNDHYNTLEVDLPDSTPLIVEYTYLVLGDDGHTFDVSNSARIKGTSSSDSSDTFKIRIKVRESSAQADANDIVLFKVDSTNLDYGLPGAEFSLYKYNAPSGEYLLVNDHIVTDEDGIATLTQNDLNTAYKLVETKAPRGYRIGENNEIYFYIQNPDDFVNYVRPANFSGSEYLDGAIIRYPNYSDKTEITVNKRWVDEQGNDVERDGTVEFELYRKIVSGEVPTTDPVTPTTEPTTQPVINPPHSDNSTLTFELHGRYDSDVFYNHTYSDIPTGSTVHFTLRQQAWKLSHASIPEIHVNGHVITDITTSPITPAGGEDNYCDITFTFTITGDTQITANVNPPSQYTFMGMTYEAGETTTAAPTTAPPTTTTTTTTTTEPATEPEFEDEFVGTYTITATNSWTYTVKNLPTLFTDDDGHVYSYLYYVKEKNSSKVSYLNNDGIDSGIITITNTLEDRITMPATGGIGIAVLYAISCACFMLCLVVIVRRRKKSLRS